MGFYFIPSLLQALQVDTAITSIFVEASGILEPVFGCLLHPVESVRVAAAWALK